MSALTPDSFERLFDGLQEVTITPALLVEHASAVNVDIDADDLEMALLTHHLQADEVSPKGWRQLLALQVGDLEVKAREAFDLLDMDGDGWATD